MFKLGSWRTFVLIFYLTIFPGLILPDGAFALNKKARDRVEYSVKKLIKSKNYDKALEELKNAGSKNPDDGWYAFRAGKIYLLQIKDYSKAIAEFNRARDIGFENAEFFESMGKGYFHLKEFNAAKENLAMAIDIYLLESRSSAADKKIAKAYVWLTKIYDITGEFGKFAEAAEAGYRYDPKNQWLPYLHARSSAFMGHVAFGEGRFKEAMAYYKKAKKLGYKTKVFPVVLDALKKRMKLGEMKPEHIQKIYVIYVREITVIDSSGREETRTDVTDTQKQKVYYDLLLLNRMVESFSNGHLGLSIEHVDAKSRHLEGARLKPDNPDHLDLEEFFYLNVRDFDTFITYSNTRSPARALARRYPYVNGVIYGPPRGLELLNPSTHHFNILLHEYFHTIEWISGGIGGPAHGFRKKFRHYFPEWKGEDEYDYYRWHFKETLPKVGWGKLIHRKKWEPVEMDAYAIESFQKIRKAYENIPLKDRMKANEIMKSAESNERMARARQALKLSPYHPAALKVAVEMNRKHLSEEELEAFVPRLNEVRSVSEFITH
jgi:tetratricopeptide (TPR) repeat protein